jgi:ABC-type amino acid transport substrate-binding protein
MGIDEASCVQRGNADLFSALKGGKCRLAVAPMMQVLPFLQSADGVGLGFLGAPMTDEGLGGDVHLVVRPDAPLLREQVDDALRAIMRDGTHDRLSRRYFPFSIL